MVVVVAGKGGVFAPEQPTETHPSSFGSSSGTTPTPPSETIEAGLTWTNDEAVTAASGVCPRCSAAIEENVVVYGDHEVTDDPVRGMQSPVGRRLPDVL